MLYWCQSSFTVNLNLVGLLAKLSPFSPSPSSPNSLSLPGHERGAELWQGAKDWARMLLWSTKAVAPSPRLWAPGINPCRHTHSYTHTRTHTYAHCCMVTRRHNIQESNGAETNQQGHLLSSDMIQQDIILGKKPCSWHHKVTSFYLILYRHNGLKGVLKDKAGDTLYCCTFYYCQLIL